MKSVLCLKMCIAFFCYTRSAQIISKLSVCGVLMGIICFPKTPFSLEKHQNVSGRRSLVFFLKHFFFQCTIKDKSGTLLKTA